MAKKKPVIVQKIKSKIKKIPTPAPLFDNVIKPVIMEVTPKLAAQWLEANISNNRSVDDSTVSRYARMISEGKWRINGESIKFSITDKMLDGQHRLRAIIRAKESIVTLVIFGLDDFTIDTIDTGKMRTLTDFVTMGGFGHPSTTACAANIVSAYEDGYILRAARNKSRATPMQILDVMARHPQIMLSVERMAALPKDVRYITGYGMSAGIHYVFAQLDREEADDFFEKMYYGFGLDPKDPVSHLRNFFLAYQHNKSKQLQYATRISACVIAWNARREGKVITTADLTEMDRETLAKLKPI